MHVIFQRLRTLLSVRSNQMRPFQANKQSTECFSKDKRKRNRAKMKMQKKEQSRNENAKKEKNNQRTGEIQCIKERDNISMFHIEITSRCLHFAVN
jgi:hypothetical protein